jgi:hypothetical protein
MTLLQVNDGDIAHSAESLLIAGDDARIAIDPASQMNAYGCRSTPHPDVIAFASSTANSISERRYVAVVNARDLHCASASCLHCGVNAEFERQRDELRTLFQLQRRECEAVFSPSGTDSQLHAFCIGRAILGAGVQSVVAGWDESGSGAEYATAGRHFSVIVADGVRVTKGNRIDGISSDARSILVPLRSADGCLRPMSEVDDQVMESLEAVVASRGSALLYIMDHSKLGFACPSQASVREICRW